jgi:hypothetical protein
VFLIVALLAQDGGYLDRVFRGSQLSKVQRKGLTRMVAAWGSEIEPEILIEQVFAEIRSALTSLGRRIDRPELPGRPTSSHPAP